MRSKRRHSNLRLTRRRWLIGSSASVALPFLPGLPFDRVEAQASSAKRLLVFFVPEGVNQETWRGEGLAPLASRRRQFSIVRGMNNQVAQDNIPSNDTLHQSAPRRLLSGGQGSNRTYNGVSVPGGQTIDMIVGRVLAASGASPSYNLGARANPDRICDGCVGPDRGEISFDRNGAARPPVNDPYRTFSDLIGSRPTGSSPPPGNTSSSGPSSRLVALRRRQSVLDSLIPELEQARCALDYEGRSKLDSHLNAVREVELEMGRLMAAEEASGGAAPPASVPTIPNLSVDPSWGEDSFYTHNASNFQRIVPLQAQIAAIALATGSVQSAVLTLGHSVSVQTYPWISGMNYPNRDYHGIAHAAEDGRSAGIADERAQADLTRIDRWFAEQFERTLGWLEEYGALDNTLVLYCSEMGHGGHSPNDLPFLIAGMGDRFRLGEEFNAGGRNHNDFLTAVLQGFGIDADRIGPDGYNRGAYTEILR